MLFHTWPFLVFFVVFYVVYLLLRRSPYRMTWLLAASYFFYGWWNPLYLLLILYSTWLDYFCVARMASGAGRRRWLLISLINNLLLLGVLQVRGISHRATSTHCWTRLQVGYAFPVTRLPLPVGISFFTFQSMSYTIDYYRGQVEQEKNFIRFATFVVAVSAARRRSDRAGPNLLPPARASFRAISRRGYLRRAVAVRRGPVQEGRPGRLTWRSTSIASTTIPALTRRPRCCWPRSLSRGRSYFDFSGYTDMARGVARAWGFS